MNFKSIGLKAALAATVVGSALAVAPAQAATFGGIISFGGNGELTSVKGNEKTNVATISFVDKVLPITAGTKSFSGYAGGDGKATFFSKSFLTSLTDKTSFVTFTKTGFDTITFDLGSFVNSAFVDFGTKTDSDGQFTSKVKGVFKSLSNPGGTAIDKDFSAFATIKVAPGTNFTNITLATTPIPTPALLPGLFGLGVAALRKRKSEESEVEAAETAKA